MGLLAKPDAGFFGMALRASDSVETNPCFGYSYTVVRLRYEDRTGEKISIVIFHGTSIKKSIDKLLIRPYFL